jgi:hypothetical protein
LTGNKGINISSKEDAVIQTTCQHQTYIMADCWHWIYINQREQKKQVKLFKDIIEKIAIWSILHF